jgi:hypothetical protein
MQHGINYLASPPLQVDIIDGFRLPSIGDKG